jgi:2-oxoisovalerate dehydrogenase E1 component alpha subunit
MKARLSICILRSSRRSTAVNSRVLQRRPFSAKAYLQQHGSERPRFPGAEGATFTTSLKFISPKEKGTIPCYRVMDTEGAIVDKSYTRDFSDKEAVKLYENMVGVSIMDLICIDAQRQGRISFYMVAAGEVGSFIIRYRQ